MTDAVHDVAGVGLGPFNLGLAALLDGVEDVDAIFFEARPTVSWHSGLMVPGATLQVPFLADLVTLADPTSPWSFLDYLHRHERLYRFYFHERWHPSRREFAAYLRWVGESLVSCRFSSPVGAIRPADDGTWELEVGEAGGGSRVHRARAVVLGVGSVPSVPACAEPCLGDDVLHSADYLDHRDALLRAGSVAVVGSGQSAAEVVLDLLGHAAPGARLEWFTRSPGFFPMEGSKLGLEHFSPEYARYFHRLAPERRDELRAGQDLLYKGIGADTSALVYDALYERSVDGQDPLVGYRAGCELVAVERLPAGGLELRLRQRDQDVAFSHRCDAVVLGTGYREAPLPVEGLVELAELDAHGRLVVDLGYRVALRDPQAPPLYVQNAELHTHGVGAPDLGLGAHRNAVIANALCGRVVLPVRERNVFQSFGAPA